MATVIEFPDGDDGAWRLFWRPIETAMRDRYAAEPDLDEVLRSCAEEVKPLWRIMFASWTLRGNEVQFPRDLPPATIQAAIDCIDGRARTVIDEYKRRAAEVIVTIAVERIRIALHGTP